MDRFSAEEKARCWLAYGSAEVWVVDPDNCRVLIYRPGTHGDDLEPEEEIHDRGILPGFKLNVRDIFER